MMPLSRFVAPFRARSLQKLLLGKMIVEGHSAGRNFCCNLISANLSWRASEPLRFQCGGVRKP
jgi:hypothetical protein